MRSERRGCATTAKVGSNKDVADGTPACVSRFAGAEPWPGRQPKIAVTKRVMHVHVMSETPKMHE